jgi:predicted DNA-binding transcriptional regulator AlpA
MLQHIRKYLLKAVDDIDSGNSTLTEEEALQVAKTLREIVRKDLPLSKYQACLYLNMSRAKFDTLVRQGKLPRGKKVPGFRELRWYKKDLKL